MSAKHWLEEAWAAREVSANNVVTDAPTQSLGEVREAVMKAATAAWVLSKEGHYAMAREAWECVEAAAAHAALIADMVDRASKAGR